MNAIGAIRATLQRQPERDCLVEIHGQRRETTRRGPLNKMIARARTFLQERGLRKGDRVGLLAPNSTQWAALDQAMLQQGIVSVPLYARQNPAELAHMLQDCGATFLIGATEELLEGIRRNWPACCRTALLEDVFAPEPSEDDPVQLDGEDPITIIYTSGTSGEPKGVILTAANMDFMVPTTGKALDTLLGGGEQVDHPFHYLPFCFAGSRVVLWTQLYRGNPLMMSTDLNNLPEELAHAKPQYMLNVPALLERIRRKVEEGIQEKGGLQLRSIADPWALSFEKPTGSPRASTDSGSASGSETYFRQSRRKSGRAWTS